MRVSKGVWIGVERDGRSRRGKTARLNVSQAEHDVWIRQPEKWMKQKYGIYERWSTADSRSEGRGIIVLLAFSSTLINRGAPQFPLP